jgi:2-amino-4-hydroxy-6-hydroxymethyldihydropteridine diphosphokinase
MNRGIFLLLGSNEGHPLNNLARAEAEIEKNAGRVISRSSVYKSAAWGFSEQPDFYNQVLEIQSEYSPETLLQKLLTIEHDMGRRRGQKWGPRLIDIDVLFYEQELRDTPFLRIPHPGIPERKFTLVPLAEIAPNLTHPVWKKTIAGLLAECQDPLRVEKVILVP